MAFQPVQYKNEDLVERKLHPEPKALRWTLRQECIEQVKRNLLDWARSKHQTVAAPYVLEECPPVLLEEILVSVLADESNSKPLKRVLEQLLVNGLEEFDFSCVNDLPIEQLDEVFQLLKVNGKKLKHIRFVGRWTFAEQASNVIRAILENAPNLEHCALQEANNEDLLCLRRNCKKLLKLEILHPSLNDEHITAFQMAIQKENSPSQLQSLALPSSVRGRGLLKILELYPRVVDLSCGDLEGLMDAAMKPENMPAINRCSKLLSLHVTQVMGWDSMRYLVETFPQVEKLSLKTQEIMNLQELTKLSNLRNLKLENSHVIPSSYTDDVLPLLKAMGKKLTNLTLVYFDVIELPKTHSYCPNLVSLELQHFTLLGCNADSYHRLQHGHKEKAFENLTHLRMRPGQGKCISQEAFYLLLKHSRRLRSMEVYEAIGLTDPLANVLSAQNGLCELNQIRLHGGHSLSRCGIETLLRKSSKLRLCVIP